MKIQEALKNALLCGGLLSMIYACDNTDKPTDPNGEVSTTTTSNTAGAVLRVHEQDDPDHMNPLVSSAANSEYIHNNLFQKLLRYNPTDLKLIPQLAVSLPEVTAIEEGDYAGGMSLTYEIHPEAVWGNGTPITGEDYVFTIKAIKNPKVNSAALRPYVQFMDDIVVDETNPKKFTIYSKERYFQAEESSGNVTFVLPEYHYDAEGIMRQFSVEQLTDPKQAEELKKDASITRFAQEFNQNYSREPESVVGSGPYLLKEWTTGERIVLERKKEWWGDKVKDNKMLEAHPPKIIYRIFRDWTSAITNAKDGQIDVLRSIPPTNYNRLKDDSKFNATFDLSSPDQFMYQYIAFNSRIPQLQDKNVRRAIAHLIDRDDLITSIMEGMGIKTNGPVHPRKEYYNKALKDIEYNPTKAKELLTAAGWKDSDGDNILDKMIGGKKVEMRLEYKYNQGHPIRKPMGIILKDEAARVGIEITLTSMDFPSLLQDADNREFELIALAWVNTPGLDDMKQVWHSASAMEGGDNRVNFGTPESDRIIDEIRETLDTEKRNKLYKRLQEIIYEEQPYIFLFATSERIAIHNRFEGTETSPARPGYIESRFKLRKK